MTRNQAIEIARQRALSTREDHGYLPVTEADAQKWMPHEWVIDAILWATMQCDLAAQQAEPSQTIYCAEKRKPGGCQLHNLHCGWPKCNESSQQAAQPVAPNIRAALQQASLALEELDGPGYLIGGVMHHRISLLLPMLNEAIDSLADAAAQPQQAADELGWLIEMQFGDGLLWWSGCFDDDGTYPPSRLIARMVNDVNKAVRFSRREDAQRVLDAMLAAQPCPLLARAKTLYSVHEHTWPEAAQPQQDAECKPYGDLRNAKWLDPECYGAGACQSLKFKAAQQAAQPVAQEPIHTEAVAEVVLDDDDVPTLRWLVEGGIADLPAGMVLMISDLPLTDDYGSGEVFRASQPQQAPLKERPDFVAGYDAGLADGRRIAEREQAAQPVAWRYREGPNAPRSKMMDGHPGPWTYCEQPDKPYCAWEGVEFEPLFAAAQPQQAISAPAQIDLSNEWPTTRYFVKQVMARFGIGPNEDIASALRKLYAEAPAQPQQASPNSSST